MPRYRIYNLEWDFEHIPEDAPRKSHHLEVVREVVFESHGALFWATKVGQELAMRAMHGNLVWSYELEEIRDNA